ncbi:MAG TPA: fibronectin type III domain-containing protein [Thermoanaerobaculia bacterium]|nr:fibronectin type III domain-containing protein [Thermoanaerobaculia bacterium]
MPARVCAFAVLVVLSLTALAQPTHLGEPFPLTATRYGTARGSDPRLLSNGREPVVFWSYGTSVRMSRLVNGRFTMSRVVGEGSYDVVWNGSGFLVVTQSPVYAGGVRAQTFDPNGEPRGDAFRITDGGGPRIAFNGRNVLLLFTKAIVPTNEYGLHALLLDRDGRPLESAPRSLGIAADRPVAIASNGDSFAALVPKIIDPQFLFFDAQGALRSRSIFNAYGAGVAIATDGRRYLGVTACAPESLCMPAVARVIEPDGAAGAAVELDQPFRANPSVVWNGAKWLVAYTRDFHLEEQAALQVVQLDADARVIERRDERRAYQSSLGVIDGRVLAAWTTNRYGDVIHAGPVPFDASTSVAVSYAAMEQELIGMESSPRGALVVWREQDSGRTSVHAGFRATDGSWTERAVYAAGAEDYVNVLVAGNGQEFLLWVASASGQFLRRLDAEGNWIGEPIALPFLPQRILGAGNDYLLFHGDQQIARMTPSGTILWDRRLPAVAGQPRVYATGSDGSLITARIDTAYVNHYPTVVGLSVVRLDADLNPIDTTPITFARNDQALQTPGVGWDGRQWIVTWVSGDGVMAAQIAASGAVADPRVIRLAAGEASQFVIKPIAGAAAILWSNELAFLRHDGTATSPLTVGTFTTFTGGTIAPLPNGDVAYAESSLYDDTRRVMLRVIASAPLPRRPSAPHLTLSGDTLSWTAPPQPVDGYRLEARTDEGAWTEIALLPAWTLTYRVSLTPGSRSVFRIRAFNEGGLGAWSSIGTRRRSAAQ